MRSIVLTDLDGTLLDAHTYDWSPARDALASLAAADVPLMLCTSKTRAEIEILRRELDNHHPFSVENGGAVYLPFGYFATTPSEVRRRDGYDVLELGTPYPALVTGLKAAAHAARVTVRGWHEMDLDEVAERCGLPVDAARRAMQREFDEPFVLVDERPEVVARLALAVTTLGYRLTRGDRFFHITGPHDKAAAAHRVVALYRRAMGGVRVVAVGDAPNDAGMLALADVAVVISSPHAAALKALVPTACITRQPGPAGWNEAILDIVSSRLST
jgi:mannosyl-3-phosphoglycerate phosphatase